jgi:MFS family permease
LLYLLAGVFNGLCLVSLQTLVQQLTAAEVRGRVLIGFGSLVQLCVLVGILAAGPVVSLLGGRWSWAAAGAFTVAVALLAWVLVPTQEGEPEEAPAPAAALEAQG